MIARSEHFEFNRQRARIEIRLEAELFGRVSQPSMQVGQCLVSAVSKLLFVHLYICVCNLKIAFPCDIFIACCCGYVLDGTFS